MALIQFLLGVNAPVSLLLFQQIFITVLVNSLIALPVLRGRAAADPAHAARRPAPAPAPRLHDRRAQPALRDRPSGSDRSPAPRRDDPDPRRPPSPADPAAGAARGDRGERRAGDVRDHVLPAVVPAGAVRATSTWPRRAATGCARSTSRRRAARSSTAAATCSSTPSRRIAVQISPADLPVPLHRCLMAHPPRRDTGLYNRARPRAGDADQAPEAARSTGTGVARGCRRSAAPWRRATRSSPTRT